jgi:integration host factor subunit beta
LDGGLSMIKSELVECVTRAHPGLYHRDAETAVDAILETIADALASGGRVEFRGLEYFRMADHSVAPCREDLAARHLLNLTTSGVGQNPRTGKPVTVDAKECPSSGRAGKYTRRSTRIGSRPHAPGLPARARPAEAAKSPANRALSHQASRGRSSPHGAKG